MTSMEEDGDAKSKREVCRGGVVQLLQEKIVTYAFKTIT